MRLLSTFELTAQNMQFLGQRGENQGGGGDYEDAYSGGGAGNSNVDDIPF
jgi:hypothetical protein